MNILHSILKNFESYRTAIVVARLRQSGYHQQAQNLVNILKDEK